MTQKLHLTGSDFFFLVFLFDVGRAGPVEVEPSKSVFFPELFRLKQRLLPSVFGFWEKGK